MQNNNYKIFLPLVFMTVSLLHAEDKKVQLNLKRLNFICLVLVRP